MPDQMNRDFFEVIKWLFKNGTGVSSAIDHLVLKEWAGRGLGEAPEELKGLFKTTNGVISGIKGDSLIEAFGQTDRVEPTIEQKIAEGIAKQQGGTDATVGAPPTQSDFFSVGADGQAVFDAASYDTAVAGWNSALQSAGYDPSTYNAQSGTIKNSAGEQFAAFQNKDGSLKVVPQQQMQAEADRRASTVEQPDGPGEELIQKVMASTGIDPYTIQPPQFTDKGVMFDSKESLAWYTGMVTEQARAEFKPEFNAQLNPEVSMQQVGMDRQRQGWDATNPVAVQQRMNQQAAMNANPYTNPYNVQAGLQNFIRSNPNANIGLGSLQIQR